MFHSANHDRQIILLEGVKIRIKYRPYEGEEEALANHNRLARVSALECLFLVTYPLLEKASHL